ncbi:hypothetical protein [Borrelia sp. HM]|uniref:hypothetical protein n=1 Tax=Borrelia sp. HM TaxID=1882662 RepID=UPI001C76D454|nr:hypothetical protein [Borrelia sp. HM]BCR21628.1 hypothetical protein BKFM_00190 [Borrelia sp. HM]
MLHKITIFLFTIILFLLFTCKYNQITDKDFSYIIIFSNPTEYLFKIKNTPFIQEEILFINEKDIELIKDKLELENIKKILLTHKPNNTIFAEKKIKQKTLHLSEVKFSLKKAIDFIFNDSPKDLKTSLIIQDNTLNKEDSEHLNENAKKQNINITMIDNKNIQYLKNMITPKITRVIIFSMKNNHVFVKKFSESAFFPKIEFTLIGNNKKDLKKINVKYIIGINELDLIKIVKKINKNSQYEFNIYKK